MLKILLCSLSVLLATLSHAQSSIRDDLVGDWLCEAKMQNIHAKNIIRYHQDGWAHELIEYIDKSLPPYQSFLNITSITYDWHVQDDKLYMTNQKINEDYTYHFIGDSLVKLSDQATADIKAEVEQLMEVNNQHSVEFDGKDRHRYIFEDGFFGECRRLT
ncbi:hypothetical protein LU276_04845 [Moraxella haemolytica]|uniref:hypothetical protein n=1 Tax=Moraxella TaxID=475 RepID=UPI00254270BC|nr:hypothetical protein [Moraxella sp. ZY171148]WII96142.1 hypothetical protein LU276_04845 [Moraxella sp. ZY171148]